MKAVWLNICGVFRSALVIAHPKASQNTFLAFSTHFLHQKGTKLAKKTKRVILFLTIGSLLLKAGQNPKAGGFPEEI